MQTFAETLVTPASHRRVNLSDLAAITFYDGREYHTINAPRALFKGRNGLTVQGPTPNKTVRTARWAKNSSSVVALVGKSGEVHVI